MLRKLLAISILFVGLCLTVNALAASKELALEEIRQLIKKNRLEQALTKTKQALVQYPEDSSLQYYSRHLRKKLKKKQAKAVATKSAPAEKKATAPPKDKTPPRIQDRTARKVSIAIDATVQIRAEILDQSQIKRAWAELPKAKNADCRELELKREANNVYAANVPPWCLGRTKSVAYRLAAQDIDGNRTILGANDPLIIDIQRTKTQLEKALWLALPAALVLLVLAVIATLWQRRRAGRRIQRALARHAREQELESQLPVPRLATSDRLDVDQVKNPRREVREKKFKRRVNRAFNVGRKQDEEDDDE